MKVCVGQTKSQEIFSFFLLYDLGHVRMPSDYNIIEIV